jgi:hypothetical protein
MTSAEQGAIVGKGQKTGMGIMRFAVNETRPGVQTGNRGVMSHMTPLTSRGGHA